MVCGPVEVDKLLQAKAFRGFRGADRAAKVSPSPSAVHKVLAFRDAAFSAVGSMCTEDDRI